jgi:hypothetical protein
LSAPQSEYLLKIGSPLRGFACRHCIATEQIPEVPGSHGYFLLQDVNCQELALLPTALAKRKPEYCEPAMALSSNDSFTYSPEADSSGSCPIAVFAALFGGWAV